MTQLDEYLMHAPMDVIDELRKLRELRTKYLAQHLIVVALQSRIAELETQLEAAGLETEMNE